MNRYLTALIFLAATTAEAQTLNKAPRLVVDITIDQLRTDYLEAFAPLYGENGFKKLLAGGRVYEGASYPFIPIDRASAVASVITGTTPYYNNIVSTKWLSRKTLRPVDCVAEGKQGASPDNLATSTIGDELKVATDGKAFVYALASHRDEAVLSAGHAADGAIWFDDRTDNFTTSHYYSEKSRQWLSSYLQVYAQKVSTESTRNLALIMAAKDCVTANALGRDDVPDLLCIALSAKGRGSINWMADMESVYRQLDSNLGTLVGSIEAAVGKDNVLFCITSTGYTDEQAVDYKKYRIPTGTFYINRTANLLNVFLGAIYGQGRYVDACFQNQIYLNQALIEQKHISLSDIHNRCQEFLMQISGVRDVFTTTRLLSVSDDLLKIRNGHNPAISGDIIIETAPGWELYNEDNQQRLMSRNSFVPFPIIFYGASIKPQRITAPVTVDRIAPTISKAIHIRAPNAAKGEPLF